MTTEDCCNWAERALGLARRTTGDKISLHSAVRLTRPADADESDFNFTMTRLTALAVSQGKQEVEDFSDPSAALLAQANRDALVRVLAETNVCISAAEFNKWRPTKRTRGTVDGMPVAVECVATDGNLGLFLPLASGGHNLGSAYIGHVHRFEWLGEGDEPQLGAPPTLFSSGKGKPSGPPKPKKKTKKQLLDDFLASI